jgi:hypothetical protein
MVIVVNGDARTCLDRRATRAYMLPMYFKNQPTFQNETCVQFYDTRDHRITDLQMPSFPSFCKKREKENGNSIEKVLLLMTIPHSND